MISFFWVCGYNKLNEFNEGDLVFADVLRLQEQRWYGRILRRCNRSQVVILAWHCRHVYILDKSLERTTRELPTEGVQNILATVKHQIQQAENPMPAEDISIEAARDDITILLDYLTSEVALEEPEMGGTDPNILIDNNCTDDELHFGVPGGSDDYDDAGDEIDERDANPTASRPLRAATELERFDLRTSNVDGYEGDDGDDADDDEEEEALLTDDESMQNLKD